jgi:choline dehydrogenase-like flavoprotein
MLLPQLLVVRPKSRGSVTLRSGDPFEAPHLDAGFCSDPAGEDMQTLRWAQTVLPERALMQGSTAAVTETLAWLLDADAPSLWVLRKTMG